MNSNERDTLSGYSACDISDALLKLQSPSLGQHATGGFLDGTHPLSHFLPSNANSVTYRSDSPKVIALASTVLFRPKHGSGTLPQGGSTRSLPSSNIDSKAARWVDETTPSTIVVIEQPPGQTCAVIGGMMALRMKKLGAKGVVVSGRVRDMEELEETGLTIYAKGTSTVGTAAESEIHAIQVPIQVGDVEVRPGDIIFCDPVDGTVVIPQQLLPKVLEILPKLKEDDDNVKRAISEGMSVKEAFDRFRRKEF